MICEYNFYQGAVMNTALGVWLGGHVRNAQVFFLLVLIKSAYNTSYWVEVCETNTFIQTLESGFP